MTDTRSLAYRMHEAFNSRNFDAADDIFTPDFFSHPLQRSGVEHVKEVWNIAAQKFPEMRTVVEDVVTDGERVALRATVSGFPGEEFTMLEMFRVADGRIAELWGVSNQSVANTVRDTV
ncbi:ester cyclase [Amycolatopsis cynarae]|uniref:Ester cyclase n=1 Tax=Amycolatopsis cynarae TaxID=2995223 RepID=A0ABY7B4M3_9PSEU|nr:ester cyclase [Amycolatopsis sp. HUAS 11-8]WAL66187.1 ester cyclase [Amycolatopsis sp. HUAS 11-8]